MGQNKIDPFDIQYNAAQYKGSDYSNVVLVRRNISLEEAKEIALNDPEIDYFVYMRGGRMVLEIPPEAHFDPNNDPFGLVSYWPGLGYCRVFQYHDAVFFKNEGKWLGSAPGFADVYSKKQ